MAELIPSTAIPPPAPSRPPAGSWQQMRIDPPHVIAGAESPPAEGTNAAPATQESSLELREQLQAQAGQLAEHLLSRQRDIDRREARLHTELAQFDQERRKARQWFEERQQELTDRETELVGRERQIADQVSRVSAAEGYHEASRRETETQLASRERALARRTAELDELAARLAQREAICQQRLDEQQQQQLRHEDALRHERQEFADRQRSAQEQSARLLENLERRRLEIEQQAALVEADRQRLAGQHGQREQQIRQQWAEMEARARQISAAESTLQTAQAELEDQRREISVQRDKLHGVLEANRLALAGREEAAFAQLAAERATLSKRAELLDNRQVTLDRKLDEMHRVQRETLEARLALEELWAELSADGPTPALTRSLSRLRGQIADEYRLAQAELTERQGELETLASRLIEHQVMVVQQRREVQDWVLLRLAELEQRAAALADKERAADALNYEE